MDQKPKVERKIYKTYLAVIKNSLGTKMFKNFYVEENGKEFDAMRDSELSCAFFVSAILKIFDFIKGIHGTVEGTVEDMKKSGWQKISEPRKGCVVVYKEKNFGQEDIHKHIGFFIDDDKVISGSSEKGYPVEHRLEMDKRGVEAFYWSEKIK